MSAFVEELLGLAGNDFPAPTVRKTRGRPKGSLGRVARAIRTAVIDDLTERYDRMTVRQIFYALEVGGIVEKTEAGYAKVQKQLTVMRREGLLDWAFIVDGTRWQRKPSMWDSASEYIESVTRTYRRDLWRSQAVRLEIWLEKDALADLVSDVTYGWGVALMVSRGQSSVTFLHAAAEAAKAAFEQCGVSTHIYALYDHDAGGDRAARRIAADLPEFAPKVPLHFTRLAITMPQISEWRLPTRPPKAKDPEAAKWGDKPAVELDAIPPDRLNGLVEEPSRGILTAIAGGSSRQLRRRSAMISLR
jgi:hypothetical protein